MIFGFGLDIKLAGSASLIVSLPIVAVGVWRYAVRGTFNARGDWTQTIVPMGVGSMIGAVIGGWLVGSVSQAALKVLLGAILLVSAVKLGVQSER